MKRDKTTNVLIVGVGGQGILLSADILALLLVENGYDVKQAEIHGMSQRGGSVHSMIRFGKHVESPLIGKGEADYLVAYEELEAMRWAPYVKADGRVIMNMQRIASAPIALGAAAYPEDPAGRIGAAFPRTKQVEATALARQAGNARAANLVMLGALAVDLPFTKEQWTKTIIGRVPAKTLDVNQKAFDLGWEV